MYKYASYNLAKTIKELGFDGECNSTYMPDESFIENAPETSNIKNSTLPSNVIGAPLLDHVYMWVIETYKIHPLIIWYPNLKKWKGDLFDMETSDWLIPTISNTNYYIILEKLIETATQIIKERNTF